MPESRLEKIQTIAAILSLAAGGALGVIGWRLGNQNIGYYLGVFLATEGLLALTLYLGNYRALTATLPRLVGDRSIHLTPGAGMQGLLSMLAGAENLVIVPTAIDIAEAVTMARQCAHKCSTTIVLPPDCVDADIRYENINVQFALTSPAFTTAVLRSNSGNRFLFYLRSEAHWLMLPSDIGITELGQQLLDFLGSTTFDPRKAVNPDWLGRKIREASDSWRATQEGLSRGRIECVTPNAIYSEQLRLSDGAEKISALDMTEISEWLEPHGLGGCIAMNIRSAVQNGPGSVRRIIYVPSRDYFTAKPDYAQSLRKVLAMHLDNSVDVGLIFQTDIADKSLIMDSVLYRGSVLWVETSPTTRFAGTGYFSTLATDVQLFSSRFEKLWRGEFCPNPADEARRFVSTAPASGS
jgi:hypothetical protein